MPVRRNCTGYNSCVFAALENHPKDLFHHLVRCISVLALAVGISACASIMTAATSGLANSLSSAILNQDDPETVRDGAPAYLLMLDSFVEGSPDDATTLRSAAELYAVYGISGIRRGSRSRTQVDKSIQILRAAGIMCRELK